jgi:hypothetical protein
MTGRPALADLLKIMARAAAHPPTEPQRSPVAVLVTDPTLDGVFCTYAALGLSKLTIRVFRALGEPLSGWPQTRAPGEPTHDPVRRAGSPAAYLRSRRNEVYSHLDP